MSLIILTISEDIFFSNSFLKSQINECSKCTSCLLTGYKITVICICIDVLPKKYIIVLSLGLKQWYDNPWKCPNNWQESSNYTLVNSAYMPHTIIEIDNTNQNITMQLGLLYANQAIIQKRQRLWKCWPNINLNCTQINNFIIIITLSTNYIQHKITYVIERKKIVWRMYQTRAINHPKTVWEQYEFLQCIVQSEEGVSVHPLKSISNRCLYT